MIKKRNKKKIIFAITGIALVAVLVAGFFYLAFASNKVSREFSLEEAQVLVEETLADLPKATSFVSKEWFDKIDIKVNDVTYGNAGDMFFKCSYNTYDFKSVIEENKQEFIDGAYAIYNVPSSSGTSPNATKICLSIYKDILAKLENPKEIVGEIDFHVYEVSKGVFKIYLDEEIIDKITGGFISANSVIDSVNFAYVDGVEVDISTKSTLRTGIKDCWALGDYYSENLNGGNFVQKWVKSFATDFKLNFIESDRWMYLVDGLGTTLAITGVAGVMGMILGFIVAIIRCTNETTGKLFIADRICRFYLTIIRGTPVMVQLLIIYFVLLLPLGVPKFLSAVLCFGLNSGAYVAEIVRGGIMSIDKGQNEAGRSLGFNFPQTMIHFIIPQAFKAVLPSLANEFITLLKESSVAFYIGIADLTQAGLKIRSQTYTDFMPLLASALIYLVIVLILTKLVGILERRLRRSDH